MDRWTNTAEPAPSTAANRALTPERLTSWKDRIVPLVPLAVLLALVLVVTLKQPNFASLSSMRGLFESVAPLLLLALGQMFVILTGGIDLAFAAVASFGTVLLALWLPGMGPGGIVLALLTTSLIGFLNGFVVAKAQVPSFIVTLGSLGLYSGLGLWISGASTIRVSEGYGAVEWISDLRLAQLPASGVFAILIAVVIAVLMATLKRGRALNALGLAEPAVLMSGVSTTRLRILAFTLSGLFSGLAAVMLVALQRAGGPSLADSMQLPAIAAVVIGGTAITGGVGGAMKTLVGALIIVVLRVGLSIVGVEPAWEQVFYGAVIIAAVALTIDRSRLRTIK
jgi:ribose transport system permease protein